MHIPVLPEEVGKYLSPQPNENFIDCTFGNGGHALAILEKIAPQGKLLGIEIDSELCQKFISRTSKQDRLTLINDSYTNLPNIIQKRNFQPVNGILFDLGMSSWHLEESKKGFSFQKDEPLDMRYSRNNSLVALEIVNNFSESEIKKILEEYGQERFSERIAREIIRQRRIKPIRSTFQLVEIIRRAVPQWYRRQRIHFATRTFQAIRIVVNDELSNLEQSLSRALEALSENGRLGVISFHSLEDKIVKDFLKAKQKEGLLRILTKKPVTPQKEEIKINKRSRSAKLRAAVKI